MTDHPNYALAAELTAGPAFKGKHAGHWTADIDDRAGNHYGKVQCYARTEQQATELRDRILAALRAGDVR